MTDAARAAELNLKTWQSLERGTRVTRDSSYAGIERTLQWAPGSIETILDGGEPTPAGGSTATQAPDDSLYRDPLTGELYQDEAERDLWVLDRLPAETRRRLIYFVRAERQAQGGQRAS